MGLFDSLKRKNSLYDETEETELPRAVEMQTQIPAQRSAAEMKPAPTAGGLRMRVLRPTEFADATKVADCLKSGQAVVLNLENMDDDDARRMIDYIAGVLYAVEGKIERPAQRTFLLMPSGVSIASEEVARLHPEI